MNKAITVRHSCNIGDLIASLCGLYNHWKEYGNTFSYLQELNVDGVYVNNAYHPTQEGNKQVMCNKKMFDMIKPLVESQPYIADFQEYVGQDVVVDFNKIRIGNPANIPNSPIQAWYGFVFPDLHCDISQPWISVPKRELDEGVTEINDKILVNFTHRYRNQFIQYYFLKEYESQLLFLGTELEHNDFCKKWNLEIPRLLVDDFYQLAQLMLECKFFLGNQSFCWNLATALGVPRILEMYEYAPNCIPFVGKHNYGYYHQNAVEFYFKKLINENTI